MLAFAWQFGLGDHPRKGGLLPAVGLIAGFAVAGLLLLAVAERVVPRLRHAAVARRQRQQRLASAAMSEQRCRALMDELCPDGWQAQIDVFASADDLPEDAPAPERNRVHLRWVPLGPRAFPEPVTERGIWAPSIRDALESMVADRMTDETLLEIERQALADGAEWPDS